MNDKQAAITRNYLQFCYACPDAAHCETEEKCLACWEQNGLLQTSAETSETYDFLRMYSE